MRSVVVFKTNTPVVTATSTREAVTTGGQNDVYTTLLTTRGRLRKKSGARGLDLGLIEDRQYYELICRFQSSLNSGLRVNGKVFVDSVEYTIQTWEVIDQINHLYKFDLACQNLSGSVVSLGDELISNGTFTGNADGWNLGTGWSYGSDKLNKVAGTASTISQPGPLDTATEYRIYFTVTGSTNGYVGVYFQHIAFTAHADGVYYFDAYWTDNGGGSKIMISVSADFNGSIDNVSVKEIL